MILDIIVESVKIEIAKDKSKVSFEEIKKQALSMERNEETDFTFEKALKGKDIKFICEVKKASPSKGVIAENFEPAKIAQEYEEAGADCISVLTEQNHFKGSKEHLIEVRNTVKVPIIRKDFIIDPYQIYEAKVIGANAILLILSILNQNQLIEYMDLAHNLGLSVLVEAHDEEEVRRAIAANARIIGVNNRDLKSFQVDINNSLNLREIVPENIIFISESGIQTKEDIKNCKNANVNGVLIGETFMRADNKKELIKAMKNI